MFKRDGKKEKKLKPKKVKTGDDEEDEDGDESEWVDDDSGDELNKDGSKKIKDEVLLAQYPITDVKMVLIVREDLKMGKGKIGAQCGHATLGAYKECTKYAKDSEYWKKIMNNWSWEGQKKICVKVNSEQEL